MDVNWFDRHHRELNPAQLYELLALRNKVFIVEQNCPYQDIDGLDLSGENRHILGLADGRLVACARIIVPDTLSEPIKIGRVIISTEARGLKLGNRLMEQAIASCERHWPQRTLFLSAQTHLLHFYQRFGFIAQGDGYLEDGIPHTDMQRG